MNCFIERYNLTIQKECLKQADVSLPLYQLTQKIIAYITVYNAYRPHQSLEYKTPLEVYCQYSVTSQIQPSDVHKKIWTHTAK